MKILIIFLLLALIWFTVTSGMNLPLYCDLIAGSIVGYYADRISEFMWP
jgi:hypothetical protein